MATFDISFVSDNRFFNEFVSSADPSDFYRFRLFTVNDFNLTLNGLSQDANVALYLDANNNGIADTGEQITGSANLGTLEESISRSLGAGTYIVQINNVLGSNTPYNLRLSGIPTLIGDVGGNSASSAFDLGILGNSRIFNDFVGAADKLDYYRFRLDRVTDFSLLLNGLSQNANVRIYADENNNSQTDNNELIAALTNSGISEKSLNQPLNAGTYFVVVENASNFAGVGSDTRYNLSLSSNLPSSAIITDSNLLDSLKGLIASAAKGFARGQVLDLSPNADTIELSSDTFAQFPGGVRAFEGDDTIQGSDANEFLYGNSGADVLQGLGSDDIVLGGIDDDQIFGEDGNDYLNGNKGNDIVNGGSGSDLLRGGQDNDVLTGGDGNDVLIGDFGADTLIGGAGSDTFVLRVDAEAGKFDPNLADRLLDFSPGDRIAITGNLSITDISVNAAGTDVAIQLTATGELLGIVQNVTPEIIQSAIFTAQSTDSALSI